MGISEQDSCDLAVFLGPTLAPGGPEGLGLGSVDLGEKQHFFYSLKVLYYFF